MNMGESFEKKREISMEWIRQNWIFIVFAGLFIVMHFFGHGGCGGREEGEKHEGHPGRNSNEKKEEKGGKGCC